MSIQVLALDSSLFQSSSPVLNTQSSPPSPRHASKSGLDQLLDLDPVNNKENIPPWMVRLLSLSLAGTPPPTPPTGSPDASVERPHLPSDDIIIYPSSSLTGARVETPTPAHLELSSAESHDPQPSVDSQGASSATATPSTTPTAPTFPHVPLPSPSPVLNGSEKSTPGLTLRHPKPRRAHGLVPLSTALAEPSCPPSKSPASARLRTRNRGTGRARVPLALIPVDQNTPTQFAIGLGSPTDPLILKGCMDLNRDNSAELGDQAMPDETMLLGLAVRRGSV